MILKFKNAHIFFAVESIWGNLNYKFRYLLNVIITANPDNEFVQVFDIPADILMQIFATVNIQPEGVAASTNKEMLNLLIPQLLAYSNVDAVKAGKEQPNEAAQLLIAINVISVANDSVLAAKLITGKAQILA